MSGASRTLAALVVGLVVGGLIRAAQWPWLLTAADALKPLGDLWLAALRMTLTPLIFTLVASAAAGWGGGARGDGAGGGGTIGVAVGVFAVLLVLAAAGGASLMSLLLALWPTPPGALVGLVHGGGEAHPAAPSIPDQIIALIPTNPVAAAAQGEMTPLIVFALIFGLALGRIEAGRRSAVLHVLHGSADAMMTIVRWVLVLAPLGVFVLALGVALHAGLAAAGVLVQAVALTSTVLIAGIAASYVVAALGGGVGPVRFARAAAAPQAMAASTTSSMATLPALLTAAERRLGLPEAFVGGVMPLAVSTFRFGNVCLISGTAVFAAHAAGLHPGVLQIAAAAGVVILTNIGVLGLPAAAVLYAAEAPAFQAIGAPLELLPLLIATAAIPDILDTVCNVTADLAATTVIARFAAVKAGAPEPESV